MQVFPHSLSPLGVMVWLEQAEQRERRQDGSLGKTDKVLR